MSLKKIHDEQPKEFKFSDENLKKAELILKKYPAKNKKSAVMPFLYLACLLYTSPSPRDRQKSRMPSSA